MRHDRRVCIEPFSDRFRIMKDAQTSKPQSFAIIRDTGDRLERKN